MVINKIDDKIILSYNGKEVESYMFDEEINFEKLFSFLLSLNLSKKIEVTNGIKDLNESEDNLVKIIMAVVADYNDKVTELEQFKKKVEEDAIDTI